MKKSNRYNKRREKRFCNLVGGLKNCTGRLLCLKMTTQKIPGGRGQNCPKKFLQQNKGRAFPQNRPFFKSDQNLGAPQPRPQFPYSRPDNRKCFFCNGMGHISSRCPVRFQQQTQQPRNLLQLPQPGQGNPRPMGN